MSACAQKAQAHLAARLGCPAGLAPRQLQPLCAEASVRQANGRRHPCTVRRPHDQDMRSARHRPRHSCASAMVGRSSCSGASMSPSRPITSSHRSSPASAFSSARSTSCTYFAKGAKCSSLRACASAPKMLWCQGRRHLFKPYTLKPQIHQPQVVRDRRGARVLCAPARQQPRRCVPGPETWRRGC